MVEWIDINGKQYPVRIGYLVMKRVKEKTGEKLEKAFQKAKDDIEIHETILWAALQTGAYAEKRELDLKEEDMPFILDLCFNEYLKVFSSDKFFPKQEDLDEQAKKLGNAQTAGKKTNPSKKA